MAFLRIKNIAVRGVSAAVPSKIEENKDYEFFTEGEAQRVIESTGIERRRIAEQNMTSSDLCFAAAKKLIDELKWNPSEIDCLLYVSQTPDYILPPTSCILQSKLGLSKDCFTIDSSSGCPGWINGISMLSALVSQGTIKKGLLLVGETPSKYKNRADKSAWPLFGDAGTATAIEYEENAEGLYAYMGTDGDSYTAIIIPEGGFRYPFNKDSLTEKVDEEDGMLRNGLQTKMDGMIVFTFGVRRGAQSVLELANNFSLDLGKIDYLFVHQANKYMNEKIRKKLKLSTEKVPYSLKDYGNTSCATIPLTIVVGEKYKDITKESCKIAACSFGVGLSWGSVYFESEIMVIPPLIEV